MRVFGVVDGVLVFFVLLLSLSLVVLGEGVAEEEVAEEAVL